MEADIAAGAQACSFMSSGTNPSGSDASQPAEIPAESVRAFLGELSGSAESEVLDDFLRDADPATLAAFVSLSSSGTQGADPLSGFLDDLLGPDPLTAPTSNTASESTTGAVSTEQQAPSIAVARPVSTSYVTASTGARKNPVVMIAPSRGAKRVEVSRQRVVDQRLPLPLPVGGEKRALEQAGLGSASPSVGGLETSPSSACAASGSAGAGSSSGIYCAPLQPATAAPLAPGERERCHLCGAPKRGFGRGYCSVPACRERSTVVVRYEQRTAGGGKSAKLSALADAGGEEGEGEEGGAAPELRAKPSEEGAVKRVAAYPASGDGGSSSSRGRDVPAAFSWVEGDAMPRLPPPHVSEQPPPPYEAVSRSPRPPGLARSSSHSAELAGGLQLSSERDARSDCDLLTEAYVLALPAGFLGLHWFYLGRPRWGALYLLTCGLVGVGWALDILRMPLLVSRSRRGFATAVPGQLELTDMYTLTLSPLGILLGAHHWALERYSWAMLHVCTVGFFGVGWALDLFRLPCLVSEYNARKADSKALENSSTTQGAPTGPDAGRAELGAVPADATRFRPSNAQRV